MKGHKGIRAGWAVGNQYLYKMNHARAKEMKQNPTETEAIVWEIVRANRLGCKFRRQQTIGEYIADFLCVQHKLVVEIDGGIHLDPEQAEWDRKRDEWMETHEYKVIRIKNEEVVESVDLVRRRILEEIGMRIKD